MWHASARPMLAMWWLWSRPHTASKVTQARGAPVNLLAHLPTTLAQGQAAVLVHAINPYGFAWTRRVNEDNVDLNRNFVDHDGSNYPENDLFERLAEHIIPAQWDDASVAQ